MYLMKLKIFTIYFSLVIAQLYSMNIPLSKQEFCEINRTVYNSAKEDLKEILYMCEENHLVRKSFICMAKYDIKFTKEYLTEITPCYLEQLILKLSDVSNNFKNSDIDLSTFVRKSYDLKTKCYMEIDETIKNFR